MFDSTRRRDVDRDKANLSQLTRLRAGWDGQDSFVLVVAFSGKPLMFLSTVFVMLLVRVLEGFTLPLSLSLSITWRKSWSSRVALEKKLAQSHSTLETRARTIASKWLRHTNSLALAINRSLAFPVC